MKYRLTALAAFAVSATTVWSAGIESLSAYASLVRSGGAWSTKSGTGYWRSVLYVFPGEAARQSLKVQMIGETKEKDDVVLSLVKDIEIPINSYVGYVRDLNIVPLDEQRIALEVDIEMKGMDGVTEREIYLVEATGAVKVVVTAKGQALW